MRPSPAPHVMTQRSIVRIERSRRGLERLGAETEAWLQRRVAGDAAGQYRTQLTTLNGVLDQALRGLGARLDGVDPTAAAGAVYEACFEIDGAAAWTRRVWEHYRERFDQREDPRYAAMLRAADEVVWSCYAEPLRIATGVGPGGRLGAAPLPWVDEVIAPEAALRQEPPLSLRLPRGVAPAVQAEMDAFLRSLPIPTVALPPECADAPWWLAILGHEVGHTVLADLSPQAEGEFGAALESAALESAGGASAAGESAPGAPGPEGYGPDDAARWRRWAHEVFADAFFVLVMGSAGVVAVEELETASPEAMEARRTRYPPGRARLALVRALAAGPGPGSPSDGAPPGAARSAELAPGQGGGGAAPSAGARDAAAARCLAPGIPAIPLTGAAGPTTLEALARSPAAELGAQLRAWTDGLRGRAPLVPRRESRAARRLAGAGLLAWREVAGLGDPGQREEARGRLAEALLDGLPRCREDGVRGAEPAPAARTTELGARLAGLVLRHAAGEGGEGAAGEGADAGASSGRGP